MNGAPKRGFTLIEVLVSIVLVAVGVTGTLSAMSAMAQSQVRIKDAELMERLAADKLSELISTGDAFNGNQSGNFDDQGITGMTWSSVDEPSGVENLEAVTVTVTKNDRDVSVSDLKYRAPAATGATAGGTQ